MVVDEPIESTRERAALVDLLVAHLDAGAPPGVGARRKELLVADARPCLHHVVFCVERSHRMLPRTCGTSLASSSSRSICPTSVCGSCSTGARHRDHSPSDVTAPPKGARVQQFLDDRGEGAYSVVVLTSDIDGPVSVGRSLRSNTAACDRTDSGDGFPARRSDAGPVHGMPITFIATDLQP